MVDPFLPTPMTIMKAIFVITLSLICFTGIVYAIDKFLRYCIIKHHFGDSDITHQLHRMFNATNEIVGALTAGFVLISIFIEFVYLISQMFSW